VLGRVGLGIAVSLVCAAAAVAATPPAPPNLAKALKAFHRPHHAYDTLPAPAKPLVPSVVDSRRVATAIDVKKHQYYVYVTQMKNKNACVVLVQGARYAARCKPWAFLFEPGRETTTVAQGLIAGIAQNDVTKLVFTGSGKRKTIPLTTDNGYIYGCPSPGTCARWVHTVLGYNAAGKLVSTETVMQ